MRKVLRVSVGMIVVLAAMALAIPAQAVNVTATWDLRCTTGCSPDELASAQFTANRGNIRTFNTLGSDGQNKVLEAAAFRRDNTTGLISTAFLGWYTPGLGVINSSTDNSHTVDNSPAGTGFLDFIVFKFAQDTYDPVSARLDQFDVTDTSGADSDADSYVGGTILNPANFAGFSGQSYAALMATLFHQNQDCNNGANGTCTTDPRDIFFTGTNTGRYLVIAAEDSNGTNDSFKVSFVTGQVAVPEPATMLLLGSGLITLALARRRRG